MPTLSAGAVGFGVAHWLGALPECVWARQRRGVAFRENHTVELVLVLATAGSITRSRTRQQYQEIILQWNCKNIFGTCCSVHAIVT
jgi:hypothetical protein